MTPFDYTVYTSVMCAESLRFYWLTYGNSRVFGMGVDLGELLKKTNRAVQFELSFEQEFKRLGAEQDGLFPAG